MGLIRDLLKGIPGARSLYYRARQLMKPVAIYRRLLSQRAVFADIYKNNRWGGNSSVSGTGSDDVQTRVVARELPRILKRLQTKTMLDIPCGDYFWMQHVALDEVSYTGADIVSDLIDRNIRQFEGEQIRFEMIDLVTDKLPRVDLVFCRDCLVHLSYKSVWRALSNICVSDSGYLLTTTFPEHPRNRDIVTGEWRPLNLQAPPFNLPEPLESFEEGCSEGDGRFRDKSLALWRISDLREHLQQYG